MKNILILMLVGVLFSKTAICQQPKGDVAVSNLSITPAPAMVNQSGTFKFTVSFTSQESSPQALNGWPVAGVTIANDPLIAKVTLNNVVPDNADPLLAVSFAPGSEGGNAVTYNPVTKEYKFTQTSPISDGGGYLVTINIKHTVSSTSPPANGFIVNLEVPGYLDDQTPLNNTANSYTTAAPLLPVKLVAFSGVVNGCENRLSWSTSQEQNSKWFEIEKSTDGRNYSSIGRVTAAGNSNSLLTYSFSDISASGGNNYYRLKQVDIDDRFIYSETVQLTSKCREPKASVYPNPVGARQDANVIIENFGKTVYGYLYDAAGKQLQQVRLTNGTNKVNVSSYASGNYMLKINDENNNTASLKITVAR
jgi:Secretion system C-terminal sorting domain